jgi:hypothetical protein
MPNMVCNAIATARAKVAQLTAEQAKAVFAELYPGGAVFDFYGQVGTSLNDRTGATIYYDPASGQIQVRGSSYTPDEVEQIAAKVKAGFQAAAMKIITAAIKKRAKVTGAKRANSGAVVLTIKA